MSRKSGDTRNREQRERQQKLRDANRIARRPDRDDVARTALFMTISSMAARDAFEEKMEAGELDTEAKKKKLLDAYAEELRSKYPEWENLQVSVVAGTSAIFLQKSLIFQRYNQLQTLPIPTKIPTSHFRASTPFGATDQQNMERVAIFT